jgi:hypothetical protein
VDEVLAVSRPCSKIEYGEVSSSGIVRSYVAALGGSIGVVVL